MSGVLYPIVFYDILEGVVATQSCQSSLSCKCLYVASYYVIHAVFLEGSVLVPNHLEFAVNLPKQKPTLQELEREIVESEYFEIPPNEERICVGG